MGRNDYKLTHPVRPAALSMEGCPFLPDLLTGICSGCLWKKYINRFNWTLHLFNRGKLCVFCHKRSIFEPDNILFPGKIIGRQHYACTNACRPRHTACYNRCNIPVGICAPSEGAVKMLRYTIKEITSVFLNKSTAFMLIIYSLYIISFYPPGEYRCLSFGEYILLAICDTRYFTLIFPALLTVYFLKLASTPSSMVLSRVGTFPRYFVKRTIKSEVLRVYRSLSSSSFAAITATVLYLTSGYTLYHTVLSTLFLLTDTKPALVIVLVNFFVTLCSVQYGIDARHPALFLKNYISLPYALMFGIFPWSQIIALCVWGLILLLVKKRWWCRNRC